MGRYTTTVGADYSNNPAPASYNQQSYTQPTYNQSTYGTTQQYGAPYMQQTQSGTDWPTFFPKPVIGLEREGVIIEDIGQQINSSGQINVIPGSLEAIKMMRLKGYKVVIITDQPGVVKGKATTQQVDSTNQYLMQLFGQAGIMSIDGLLYSTSDLKDDMYAKPNTGMFKRAETEFTSGINWSEGWFVGHNLKDAVVADKVGAKPVILMSGNGEKSLKKMESTGNYKLREKTLLFNNLLQFAESLD